MYRKDDTSYFIVDAHVALWDARPENQRNIHGKQFIDCFYDYHRNLSPESEVWSYEEYLYQGGERLMKDLFDDGYVDHAIFQPAALGEFYYKGFGQTDEAFELACQHPDKLTYNHNFDPRNGEAGLDQLREDAEKFGLKGVKLYTAEWHGESRGWQLDDPWAYRYFEACRELGIRNIHVHKGPTIRPLDRDAFDVADVDHVASRLHRPELHRRALSACHGWRTSAGSPPRSPTCTPGSRWRCRSSTPGRSYFAQIIGELLYWIGEDRIQFSSDYALWTPQWLIEAFVDFQIPEDLTEYAPITTEQKKKILGLNAAKMYDIAVPAELQLPEADETATGPRAQRSASRRCRQSGRAARRWAAYDGGVRRARRRRRPGAGRADHRPRVRPVADGRPRCGNVEVHLRLPTSFCSPNFAYLMASRRQGRADRVAVDRPVVVELDDHHDSAIINAGLAADAGYRGTFGHEAE